MRNLKRVLSLALAALMLMGMMVVGAGAASKDFTDASEIKNVEAVDVMVALGVLEGGDKGDFQPNSILTREQAAKIICYLLLGSDAAEKLTTNYSIFSDVPANRWSAPYISYCVNLGILAGDGNGHFYPEGKLTGVAFAKMLMVALGYSAERENFIGNNWEINVSARAIETGIAPKGLVLSKELSRQDAAQMSFNTLKATMVEYQNDTTIIVGGTTVSTSSKATPVAQGSYANTMGAANLQFAEKNFPDLKKIADTDAFVRPATTWRNGNTTVGTYADTADASYTAAVKVGEIYSDLGLTKGISSSKVSLYVDGTSTAWTHDIVKGDVTNEFGGNGVLTEVFYDADAGTIQVVEINTYVAKVAAAYAATTTKDAYVDLTTPNTGAGTTYETDAFAKNDIVLYTYSNKTGDRGIQSMTKANAVTGVMNGYTDGKSVTVDGTAYKQSEKAVNITNYNTTVGKEVTVYTDTYGYAVYVDADTTLQYAVVLAYEGGNSLDNARAKLLFPDGTVKVVDVDKFYLSNGTTQVGSTNAAYVSSFSTADSKAGLYDVVSYTINSDNQYTLKLAADAREANVGSAVITNGMPTLNLVSGNGYNVNKSGSLIANGNTVFVVIDESGSNTTYSVYEGIAKVPTIKWNGGTYTAPVTILSENNTTAKLVVVVKTKISGQTNNMTISDGSKEVTLIKGSSVGQSYTSNLGYYYEYAAIIDGVEGTIKTTSPVTTYTLVTGVAYNSKGVATGWNDSATLSSSGTNVKAGRGTGATTNDVMQLAGTYYAFTNDCKVYYISTTGELTTGTAASITKDTDNEVWFKLTDGLVSTVFIKVVDATNPVGPGTGKLSSVSVSYDSSNKGLDVTVNTSSALSTTNSSTVTLKVEKYMESTNTWLEVGTGTATVNSSATTGTGNVMGGSLTTATTYRVTATYDGGTVVSSNFTTPATL